MELDCPNCGKRRLDEATLVCAACGLASMNIGDTIPPIEALLPGFLRNIQVLLFDLEPGAFQQIRGIISPDALGRGGVEFTDETATTTQSYLAKNGVPCLRVRFTVDRRTQVTLLIASTPDGLRTGMKEARKTARRKHAVVDIQGPVGEA